MSLTPAWDPAGNLLRVLKMMLLNAHDSVERGEFPETFREIEKIMRTSSTLHLYVCSPPLEKLVSRIVTDISVFGRLFAASLRLYRKLMDDGHIKRTCVCCCFPLQNHQTTPYLSRFCAECSWKQLDQCHREKALATFLNRITLALRRLKRPDGVRLIKRLYSGFKDSKKLIDLVPTKILND